MLEELTLRKTIQFAVATEEIGAKFYHRMALKFSDEPEVAEVFAQLSRDEQVHQQQFGRLLERVPASFDDQVEYERAQYLRAMAVSEFFGRTGPLQDTDRIQDSAQALAYALGLERAALGYYLAIREQIGESPELETIIATEKQHMTQLMKIITTGAKFRSLQEEWP
jgi:rubrerythrin